MRHHTLPVWNSDNVQDIDRIEIDFWTFHTQNPSVYDELRDLALKLRRQGRKHYSIKALFEVVRFHRAIQTKGDAKYEWKLNNNYTSLYARLLMQNEPELHDFFDTRVRRAGNDKLTTPATQFMNPSPTHPIAA